MEKIEKNQLVPAPVQRKEQVLMKELPLEDLDIPVSQLLEMYKRQEVPKRWKI